MPPADASPPPPRRSPSHTRASLVSFNWNLALRSVFDTVCGGTTFVFVAFALSLGVAEEKIGLLTFTISLACITQMVTLPLVSRVGARKRLVLGLGVVEPLLMIAAVLTVPLLPPGARLPALGAAVFLAAACLNMTRPIAEDWVASTIPGGIRGRYVGRRLQLQNLTQVAATLAVGWAADRVGPGDAPGGSAGASHGYAWLLAAGGAFGVFSILALRGASMPKPAAMSHVRLADLGQVLRVRAFRHYVIAIVLYNVPFFFSTPYYQVYNLKVLGLSKLQIGYLNAGYFVLKILSAGFFGKWVDTLGPRRAIALLSPLYLVFFSLFVFGGPTRAWPVFLAWGLIGLADGGFAVAAQVALYRAIPAVGARPAYFAVYNLASLGTGAAGAWLAVRVIGALKDHTDALMDLTGVGPFQVYYGLCAVALVPCLLGVQLLAGKEMKVGATKQEVPLRGNR